MSTAIPLPSSSGSNGSQLALDNLIRRELRVGDPNDPQQVAQALMARYANTASARSLVNEAKGLPFLQTPVLSPQAVGTPQATDLDLKRARDDIEADLRELLTSNVVKEVTPELQGWASAIRSAVQEGESAARLGLDTRQRDKAFLMRRTLGDYARLARAVGTFSRNAAALYRNLAQSLDEAAAVILVMLGEAIANSGIAGGRYLLQVPFSELQQRREAVLNALRNLSGASQYSQGIDDWPRGIDAYRQLYDTLDKNGQGDLRSLLVEGEMTRVMDQMIDRAGQGIEGLRALGVTAQVDLQRMRRLSDVIGYQAVDPESPALTTMQEALQLFMDGFSASGGMRLLNIARPSILSYGLYGSQATTPAESRLGELVRLRGQFALALDCYTECECDAWRLRAQYLADKALYDLDRAIDLYSVGENDMGAAEMRASAYGWVFHQLSERKHPFTLPQGVDADAVPVKVADYQSSLQNLALQIFANLVPPCPVIVTGGKTVQGVPPLAVPANATWEPTTVSDHQNAYTVLIAFKKPPEDGASLSNLLIERELAAQLGQEQNIVNVVQQMSDGCEPSADSLKKVVHGFLQATAKHALGHKVDLDLLVNQQPNLPSTLETSADGQTYARLSDGQELALTEPDLLKIAFNALFGAKP